MKNVYEILEQKQADLDRVRRELESLKLVAPLLSDETTEEPTKKPTSAEKSAFENDSEATGTGSLFSSVAATRSSFWTRK